MQHSIGSLCFSILEVGVHGMVTSAEESHTFILSSLCCVDKPLKKKRQNVVNVIYITWLVNQ